MSIFSLTSIAAFILPFLIGILSFIKGKDKAVIAPFGLTCIASSIWAFAAYNFSTTLSKEVALFWIKVAHIGIILTPVFFFHFVCNLTKQRKKILVFTIYFFAALFLTFNFYYKEFFGLQFVFNQFYFFSCDLSKHQFYFIFYVIFYWIFLFYAFILLIESFMRATGIRRNQMKYLIIGSVIAWLGPEGMYPLVFGKPVYPYSNILIGLYPLIFAYAILRYRLMDIRVAITRAGIFAVVYALVLGLPFLAIKCLQPIFVPLLGSYWWLSVLLLGMLLASGGPFIYMFFQRRATAYLLREERRGHFLLMKASQGLTNIRDLEHLLNLIVTFVTKTLRTTNSAIYLLDKEESDYKLSAVRYKSRSMSVQTIDTKDPIIKSLKSVGEPIVLDEIRFKQGEVNQPTRVEEKMKELSASVVVPSFIDNTLLGFLVLGEKKSGNVYTESDLAVLSVLSNQAALAIENAVFYEEQGKTLAQQFQEHRLRSLGKMGSGIGHQINNRFQAISMTAGACNSLDVEELKKMATTDEQKKLVAEVQKSLNDIVQECLRGGNIARSLTQFSRTSADLKPVNFGDIIDGTLNLLICKFNVEEINLTTNYLKDGPPVLGNLALLQDTFFNHIDNAHDACLTKMEKIQNGSLQATEPYVPKVSINAYPEDGYWHIEIQDNGIGMNEEQLDQVFIPFFTTKATSEKGTGLGLSIIKKIIDAHKGTISVQSKYGEGTKFTIKLPAAY